MPSRTAPSLVVRLAHVGEHDVRVPERCRGYGRSGPALCDDRVSLAAAVRAVNGAGRVGAIHDVSRNRAAGEGRLGWHGHIAKNTRTDGWGVAELRMPIVIEDQLGDLDSADVHEANRCGSSEGLHQRRSQELARPHAGVGR